MSLDSIYNKQKIINAAFVLSLKHGFNEISIKQIKEESGLAIGSIYYHFKNKDDILDNMVKTYLTDSFYTYRDDIKNFDGGFIEKLSFIFKYKISSYGAKTGNNLQFLPERPKFDHRDYFILFKSIFHMHPETRIHFFELNKKLLNLYCEIFQEAIENNEIRDDIDIKKLIIFFQTILKGNTDMWAFHPELSIEEIIDANIKMIEEAIKK